MTIIVLKLSNFGTVSAVHSSVASKQDGGVQRMARRSSPAMRSPFLPGRVTSIPQELRLSHHYQLRTASRPSMRPTMSLEPDWGEIAKKIAQKVEAIYLVHIDQHSAPDATILDLSFGNRPSSRVGALLDTIKALKNLGLNIVRAQVTTEDDSLGKNRFYITYSESGNKIENLDLLETVRLTLIIYNLLKYNPTESSELHLGKTFGLTSMTSPKVKFDADIATKISVQKVNPKVSMLSIETADRPGLLLDIIKLITDFSIMVMSAEINTEGLVAKDQFYLSYKGAALTKSMGRILTNCLRHWHTRKGKSNEYESFFD